VGRLATQYWTPARGCPTLTHDDEMMSLLP